MTEPRAAGRQAAPGQSPVRPGLSSGALVRPAIVVGGLVGGFALAARHWIVHTELLGARLPTAVHVLLVGLFLAVVLTVGVVACLLGRRGAARRSRARRRQWRNEWL